MKFCDIYGNILEKVTAKEDGLVLYQKATLVVHQRQEVLLAVASKKPKATRHLKGRHD